jgi:hypothetical protein
MHYSGANAVYVLNHMQTFGVALLISITLQSSSTNLYGLLPLTAGGRFVWKQQGSPAGR